MKWHNIAKTILLFTIIIFTALASVKYPGSSEVFLLYSLIFNLLLFLGIRKKRSYLELFLSVFFWLGFWVKLVVRLVDPSFFLSDDTGSFNLSAAHYDHALIAASVGAFGILVAYWIRPKYIIDYVFDGQANVLKEDGIYFFYKKYYKIIWSVFILFIVLLCTLNVGLGLYQRGAAPRTVLPFKINGIFTWLLLFGAASVSTVLLQQELRRSNKVNMVTISLTMLESYLSNSSMLSRAMVLNMLSVGIGFYDKCRINLINIRLKEVLISITLFSALFIGSIYTANTIRHEFFFTGNFDMNTSTKRSESTPSTSVVKKLVHQIGSLIIDRWVGIEGIMAVTSSDKKGWELLARAWSEKFSDSGTSFYDLNLIKSPYKYLQNEKLHFISLPGLMAFLYYPGSYIFLFSMMLLITVFASYLERLAYIYSYGNIMFSSLIAQVMAYRFSNFGYSPNRSYILFGAILLNITLIYVVNKILVIKLMKNVEDVI